MQLKSIATTNLFDTINRYAHTPPAERAAVEGEIIALIDGHVREQMMLAEMNRSRAMEARARYLNKN